MPSMMYTGYIVSMSLLGLLYISHVVGEHVLRKITILDGSDAVLPCSMDPDADPVSDHLTWFIGQSTSTQSPDHRIALVNPLNGCKIYQYPLSDANANLNPDTGALTIRNINTTNQSNYTCRSGPHTYYYELIINDDYVYVLEEVIVQLGDDATLPCPYNPEPGTAPDHLTWFLGQSTSTQNPDHRIALINPLKHDVIYNPPFNKRGAHLNPDNGSLTIKRANFINRSWYTCQVGPETFHVHLEITENLLPNPSGSRYISEHGVPVYIIIIIVIAIVIGLIIVACFLLLYRKLRRIDLEVAKRNETSQSPEAVPMLPFPKELEPNEKDTSEEEISGGKAAANTDQHPDSSPESKVQSVPEGVENDSLEENISGRKAAANTHQHPDSSLESKMQSVPKGVEKENCLALHKAGHDGRIDEVKTLIKRCGGWIDYQDENGETALHKAIQKSHIDIIKLLLDNGSVAYVADENGQTGLHMAADYGAEGSKEIVRILLDRDCQLDLRDNYGQTALHLVAASGVPGASDVMAMLLQKGCKVDVRDDNGQTAFHLAATYGSQEAVKILLDHGCQRNLLDNSGKSADQLAKSSKNNEVSEFLSTNGD